MLLEDGDRKWLVEELEPGGGWGMPLVHGGRRLRLVVVHVDVGLVDAQRAARERLAELSGEGEGGKLVRWEARCERWRGGGFEWTWLG